LGAASSLLVLLTGWGEVSSVRGILIGVIGFSALALFSALRVLSLHRALRAWREVDQAFD
jgi:hypothetical protein